MTVTRPASPSFSMDFSMISPPSPDPLDSFPSAPTFTRNRGATVSSFFTPSRGRNTLYGSTYGLTHTVGCRPPLTSCKSRKTLLPRLWDAISSPGRKSKGKAAAVDQYFLGGGYSYADLQPLDGEEGELIDDEACFIDGTTVTGIDILSHLPPEIAVQVLCNLDLSTILACQAVCRTWHTLSDDNAVWRELFCRREGWGVDLERAKARGWKDPRIMPVLRHNSSPDSVGLPGHRPIIRRLPHSSPPTSPLAHNPNFHYHIVTTAPAQSASSLTPAISPWSPELPVSTRTMNPRHQTPLSLSWNLLYRNRLELDRRWASPSFEPTSSRLSGHADSVYCLEFDSGRIVTGARDQTIKVWDLDTGRLMGTFRGHKGSVLCLKFDKDWDVPRWGDEDLTGAGRKGFMVSGSSDRTVCVWDMWAEKGPNGEKVMNAEVKAVLRGHMGGVLDLRIDKDWIVSCSKDAVIRVWNRKTLELHRTLCGHEGPVNAVGLQNGRVVSASGDGKMMLWDIASGNRLTTFEGHDRGLACIEFKDDLIVSGSNDCKIKIWSASTGECVKTLVGHDALVRALAFDPASGRLVSASYDRTVKLWDMRTGKMVREFKHQHSSHIFDVKFDMRRIVSTSHDQKIVVMDFSRGLDAALFT
ncbi:WD40 repeat-like protein [Stereum hirsutum FP-91666 SS1]|uniref:WD40 repeat-like protein n=1 Tax=Stereum hirsutum (strain FP-91666) TaxID=721885 RepID=UPI000441001D|nr:WD40 repeat-like protein [Stereum hirsutum FP-91666 SS1]EIM87287.1 WD40 repeat-like protein [Stereum hirsutum FP-91666 SS1]